MAELLFGTCEALGSMPSIGGGGRGRRRTCEIAQQVKVLGICQTWDLSSTPVHTVEGESRLPQVIL